MRTSYAVLHHVEFKFDFQLVFGKLSFLISANCCLEIAEEFIYLSIELGKPISPRLPPSIVARIAWFRDRRDK
jgi:hypothetical protein